MALGIGVDSTDKQGPAQSVEFFLRFRRLLTEDSEPSAEIINRARLYHLPPIVYGAAYQTADRHTEATIFKREWEPYNPESPPPLEESLQYPKMMVEAARHIELPPLPFPTVFIGLGSGVRIPKQHLFTRNSSFRDIEWATLRALVIDSESGFVWELIQLVRDGTTQVAVFTSRDEVGDEIGWRNGMDLNAWIVPVLIAAIEQKSAFTPIPTSVKTGLKKLQKRGQRIIPPRFYSVKMDERAAKRISEETLVTTIRRAAPSFRHDVSGHTRLITRRSNEPLLTRDREALEARGYTIAHNDEELGDDLVVAFMERGLPLPRAGEWVAARLIRVSAHQRGPEDADYVPALRETR